MMIKNLLTALLILISVAAHGEEKFIVKKIYFEGLQRLTVNAALLSIPIHIGDKINTDDIQKAIHALFSTGNLQDVQVLREGNTLIIKVKESPILSGVTFIGNKCIKKDKLNKLLEMFGIQVGKVLNQATVSEIKHELEGLYYSIGRYNINIQIISTMLPSNRIHLNFIIKEHDAAKIRQINILGNKKFTTAKILSCFQINDHGLPFLHMIFDNKYRENKFLNGIQKLRKLYTDNGYVRFNINSVQMNLTPDKKNIYITIYITEGNKYKVSDIIFSGIPKYESVNIKHFKKDLLNKLYNGSTVSFIEKNIKHQLGQYGYVYPNISTFLEINDSENKVKIHVNLNVGKRYYVHKIYFQGNDITEDVVMRREMRQMEGALLRNTLVIQGKDRLQRTGYFRSVDVNTNFVPGTIDQVDVIYNVEEHQNGIFNFGFGYDKENGINFRVNMINNNWLGMGDSVTLNCMKNIYTTQASLSIMNPYFTVNGISLGGNIFYSNTQVDKKRVSNYNKRNYGIDGTLGFPINEHNTLQIGLGYASHNLSQVHPQVAISRYFDSINYPKKIIGRSNSSNGSKNSLLISDCTFHYGFTYNTLDMGVLPTNGTYAVFKTKVAIPISYNSFYKSTLDIRKYIPLNYNTDWIILYRLSLGYGNGFGIKHIMPFYENFYAGGVTTVRGFKFNSIGPKAVYLNDSSSGDESYFLRSTDTAGGNAMALSSVELILPIPFTHKKYSNVLRTSIFIDACSVWNTKQANILKTPIEERSNYSAISNISVSSGICFKWMSPFGPLTISYSKPLKIHQGDNFEQFQFNMGINE